MTPVASRLQEPHSPLPLFLYSTLLALALLVSAPWWLWRMVTSNRYREGLPGRLGVVPRSLKAAAAGRSVIWLHAVSVGEVFAAVRLVQELEAALPDHLLVVSTTTATGQKVAQERFGPERVFYFPLDFAFVVRRYLRALNPELVLLMESELWPRLLDECKSRRIPVAVVNARISDRSFPRAMRFSALWRPVLAKVTLFLAQGKETAERLASIGAAAERILVSGNLKYDLLPPAPNAVAARMESLIGERKLVVAGSTLHGEEELLLAAWPQILKREPEAVLVLAPRHPQRFREVKELLRACGSQWIAASREEFFQSGSLLEDTSIILLDTLGDLAAVYELAGVAFLGGSLIPKGGHNPLEAARFGVPVVMGPSYENFREIVESMRAASAIRIVNESSLASALADLLEDDKGLGQRGRAFFRSQAGATARTVEALLALLAEYTG